LLKLWLRELPVPLCTFENYDCFLAAVAIPDEQEQARLRTIKEVLNFLPYSHQVLLKYLVAFLCRVVAHSDHNRMNANNVAVLLAPNILQPPPEGSALTDLAKAMEDTPYATKLALIFLTQYDVLLRDFPEPLPPEVVVNLKKYIQEEIKRQKAAAKYKEKLYKDREKLALKQFKQQQKGLAKIKKDNLKKGLDPWNKPATSQ